MNEFSFKARNLTVSPQKLGELMRGIRKQPVGVLMDRLSLVNSKRSELVLKVVKSSIASLEQKGVDIDSLWFERYDVSKGMRLKRFMPRAQGRATPIRKQRCNLNVVFVSK